jgi:hypothetical protein
MSSQDALFFWFRFALTFIEPTTQMLLLAPARGPQPATPLWVDLVVGEPTPANFFCIKAGTKAIPFTSDIPYTLDRGFSTAIDGYIQTCSSAAAGAPLPPWPSVSYS